MRVLIVDDDEQQAGLLAKVIALQDESVSVSLAIGGAAALAFLKETRTDLVLTDLQMPGISGLDLVQWLMEHQPHVTVFAMTAYPDDAALGQLEEFGTVECFTKPLDVPGVTRRLSQALCDGMRGQLRNISLPSLLQLVDMERKTCTLVVQADKALGYLYFRQGILLDARSGCERGDRAATEIVSWHMPHITILSTCASKATTVERPVGFIIMESMRLQDERERDLKESREPRLSTIPPPQSTRTQAIRSFSQFPAPPPEKAAAMAVIALPDGRILTSSGKFEGFQALTSLLAELFVLQSETAARLGEPDGVEEVIVTTERYWAVCRPLEHPAHALAVSVFDPAEATVVMERLQLNGLAMALREWSRRPVAHS